jgi:hypothetical protein
VCRCGGCGIVGGELGADGRGLLLRVPVGVGGDEGELDGGHRGLAAGEVGGFGGECGRHLRLLLLLLLLTVGVGWGV